MNFFVDLSSFVPYITRMNTTRFDLFQQEYDNALDYIKKRIDVNSQEYPEYKEAATLCKFLFESDNVDLCGYIRYSNQKVGCPFVNNAQNFSELCNSIFHAIVDDGEISFIKFEDHSPVIIFQSKWEITPESSYWKEDIDMINCINEALEGTGAEPRKFSFEFMNNVYEFIEEANKKRIKWEDTKEKFNILIE